MTTYLVHILAQRDIPDEIFGPPPGPDDGGGSPFVAVLVLLVVAIAVLLLWRRRAAARSAEALTRMADSDGFRPAVGPYPRAGRRQTEAHDDRLHALPRPVAVYGVCRVCQRAMDALAPEVLAAEVARDVQSIYSLPFMEPPRLPENGTPQ